MIRIGIDQFSADGDSELLTPVGGKHEMHYLTPDNDCPMATNDCPMATNILKAKVEYNDTFYSSELTKLSSGGIRLQVKEEVK